MSNLTIIRRQNSLLLFQQFAERGLASGASTKGMEQSFASALQISPSMWSQIKTHRPIGDKLARQLERLAEKPDYWLDQAQALPALSAAERAFTELALELWRACNAAKKRTLRLSLMQQLHTLQP